MESETMLMCMIIALAKKLNMSPKEFVEAYHNLDEYYKYTEEMATEALVFVVEGLKKEGKK